MSEKEKKNAPQEEQPQANTTPETEQAAEKAAEEETFTVTREQMEQMEQLAKMVSDASDKYLRLAAEYDNYRKRTDTTGYVRYADKLKQSRVTASVYSILNSLVKSVTGCGETAYNKAVHKQYKASQPPVLCLFSCQNTECYVSDKDKYHYGSRNCDSVLEI